MTGFGAAEGFVGGSRVSVELRTVNHRFFSPSIKLPSELSRWEPDVREALRKKIARGHVTVSARTERPAGLSSIVDEVRFSQYAAMLRDLRERHGLDGPIDVATVLRMPDVVASGSEEESGTAAELTTIVESAIESLTSSRREEGQRLATYLLERLTIIEGALARIAARAPERIVAQRDRLREAVRVLTDGMAVDEQRLAQEIAILADRLDVQEELSALRVAHRGVPRRARSRAAESRSASGSGFCFRRCCERRTRRAARRTTRSMLQDVRDDQGGAGADSRAGGEPRMNPFPLILSSPSGGGKTTIARMLLERRPDAGLLGLVHDAGAANGRSERKGLLLPVSRDEFVARRDTGASSPNRPRCTATCTARCGRKWSGCWRQAGT